VSKTTNFCGGASIADDGGAYKYTSPADCFDYAYHGKVGLPQRFHRVNYDFKFTGSPDVYQTLPGLLQLDSAPFMVLAFTEGEPADPDYWSWEWEHNQYRTDQYWVDNWPAWGFSSVLSPDTWYNVDIYYWQESPCGTDNFLVVSIDGGAPFALDCGGGKACPYYGFVDALVVGIPPNITTHSPIISHWIDNVRWWYDDDILFLPDEVSPCCE